MSATTTHHTCNPDGSRAPLPFGRKAPAGTCPRCDELRNGAPARRGFPGARDNGGGFAAAKREAQRAADIRAHFAPGGPHDRGLCGPICTAFDY